jgi:phosphate transport system permease protein
MIEDKNRDLFLLRRRPLLERLSDSSFKWLATLLASLVGLILAAILLTVLLGSRSAMSAYGFGFLTTSNWNPVTNEYGALTAIYGTIVTSILSLLIAVPLGVGTAIFLTENLIPLKARQIIGMMVELLAAIPSVVLGLWAIFVMEPFLRPTLSFLYQSFGWLPFFSTEPQGPGMAPAILILVVMILPIITAISRDSLLQVPNELRQAAYGIGTTRWGPSSK